MEEKFIFIGLFLIILGVVLVFIGSVLNKKFKTEWGFFGLIGPIPIGVWSSKIVFILTLIFLFIFIIITLIKW